MEIWADTHQISNSTLKDNYIHVFKMWSYCLIPGNCFFFISDMIGFTFHCLYHYKTLRRVSACCWLIKPDLFIHLNLVNSESSDDVTAWRRDCEDCAQIKRVADLCLKLIEKSQCGLLQIFQNVFFMHFSILFRFFLQGQYSKFS